jgi:DNA-binding response OmpR family regulator
VAKILYVEDDRDLAMVVADEMEEEKHVVEAVSNGLDGYERLKMSQFDLIVLDIDLPGMSGIEILRNYRASGGTTAVLMLTGKSEVEDKLQGLDLGADDYLTKPFSMRELCARIRALLRRPTAVVTNTICVGALTLDTAKGVLSRGGKEIRLQPQDFALLEFLMKHPGQLFSAEALMERVWKFDSQVSHDGLRSAIKRIRKACDLSGNLDESVIETLPKLGYRLRGS